MTKALHPTARSRRTFSARQVFPVVATVMFLLAGALWVPVLRLSANLVDPEYLLLGMLVLLVAFLAGELFPLHIEVRTWWPADWSFCSGGTAPATSRSTCRSSPPRPAPRP
jgi:hypothetical protein